jgi:hypothetical protein
MGANAMKRGDEIAVRCGERSIWLIHARGAESGGAVSLKGKPTATRRRRVPSTPYFGCARERTGQSSTTSATSSISMTAPKGKEETPTAARA